MIIDAKNRYQMEFFMEIMIIGCWSIWNQRNDKIFKNIDCSIDHCKQDFKATFNETIIRVKPNIKEGMMSWLDSI